MEMKILTTKFDNEISKIDIFERYPEMKPFIGIDYSDFSSPVLLIGESYYLPHGSEIHKNDKIWYDGNSEKLNSNNDEKGYINIRKLIRKGKNQNYRNKAHVIYKNIELAIIDTGFNPEIKDNMFRYCAFYNYFLRPAETKISIKETQLDKDIAYKTLVSITNIIHPKIICFVSVKAWKSFGEIERKYGQINKLQIISNFVPHPACAWWNRKSKNKYKYEGIIYTGKGKFVEFLKDTLK